MKFVMESKRMVKPEAPTPDHLRRQKISSIDQLQTPGYVGLLFFYHPANDVVADSMDSGQVYGFEESLSKALRIYYPLAGRYVEDGYYIDCNDQGVELIEAKVDGHLDELMSMSQYLDLDLANKMATLPNCLKDNPLIVVQVNKFECGGLAIGLRFTHKVADLHTIVTFINMWATICRGGIHDAMVRPTFEVSSVLTPKDSVENSPLPLNFGKEKLVMNKFATSGETLRQLAVEVSSGNPYTQVDRYRPPSRVEIVLALICRALVKIDRVKHGRPRPVVVCTTMTLRGRTNTLIPETEFGNVYTCISSTLPLENNESDLLSYVKMVQEIIKKGRNRYEAVDNAEKLSLMVEDDAKSVAQMLTSTEHCVVPSTSWCGYPLYEVDFGWGEPESVMCTCPPFRQNILIDGKSDRGIDAWVVLDEVEMVHFKQDSNIMKYFSKG